MNNKLKYLLLSDIHLGHDINKTADIINNLDSFFLRYKKDIVKVKYIFILGDVFDKLLSNNNKDSALIYGWLSRLVLFCTEYNIKLRILEGTPGHDFHQIDIIDKIITNLKIDIDYKYFDKLDIEQNEDFNILYVPDEWNHKSEDTYKEVLSLLKEKSLDKVDICIMHGAFQYQIPYVTSPAFHIEDNYLSITNYTINIGHVHNHTKFEKIIVPGSFDALTFIDENIIKGGIIVTLDLSNQSFTYNFLPNIRSLIFRTIKVDDLEYTSLTDALLKFNTEAIKNKKKIHVRLYSKDKSNKLSWSLRELSAEYPELIIKYTTVIEKDTTNVKDILKKDVITRTILRLDKDNITNLVQEELISKDIDKTLQEVVLSELKALL